MVNLNPYLNFNGNTREAMEYYQSILGGELNIQTYEDLGMSNSTNDKNRIAHSSLQSGNLMFMASDTLAGQQVEFNESISMSLTGSEEIMLTNIFNRLAEEGTVTMKLEKQVWGDKFGTVKDKYGVQWLVNIFLE